MPKLKAEKESSIFKRLDWLPNIVAKAILAPIPNDGGHQRPLLVECHRLKTGKRKMGGA